jgi:hypothetical protein
VDSDRFLAELPRLFEDYPRSEYPRDRRFQGVADTVENLARENNLALLNLAASLLGPDEAYVEVGVYHGASLIASMLGNEDKRFVGIDSFAFRDATLEGVEANLERFGLPRPELLLAPGALVIVDDTDWDDVDRAMDDYLAAQPRARRILTLDGKSRGAPQWWEGMQVLVWDGGAQAAG